MGDSRVGLGFSSGFCLRLRLGLYVKVRVEIRAGVRV